MSIWIKVEIATPDKPEIVAAARLCGVSKADSFMAFFRLWAYFDEHTATGFVQGLCASDLDDMAGIKGFGKAMVRVGWLTEDETGITIKNWDRHNGDSAKKRALNQKRNQKYRANKRWKPIS